MVNNLISQGADNTISPRFKRSWGSLPQGRTAELETQIWVGHLEVGKVFLSRQLPCFLRKSKLSLGESNLNLDINLNIQCTEYIPMCTENTVYWKYSHVFSLLKYKLTNKNHQITQGNWLPWMKVSRKNKHQIYNPQEGHQLELGRLDFKTIVWSFWRNKRCNQRIEQEKGYLTFLKPGF